MAPDVKKPPQPTRTMVLALLMVPLSLWTLLLAGMYAGTYRGAIYLADGLVAFVAASLILANLLIGRWLATLWGVYNLLLGIFILSYILGYRGDAGAYLLFWGLGGGVVAVAIGVLILWMAFPRPHEQALYKEAQEARRNAKAERAALAQGG